LQATGGASLTLTVPKTWAHSHNLSSKDEVIISASSSALTIRPAGKSKQEVTAEIIIDNIPHAWLVRELIAAYIAGADKMTFRSRRITTEQNEAIRQAVQLLFGCEIFEETSQKIAVRTIFEDNRFPASESTLRIFSIVSSMFEDALKAARTGDQALATDVKLRDQEVDKFVHAIKRQYNAVVSGKLEGAIEEVSFYRSVATQLERIGDHALKIAELASINRTEPVKLSSTFPTIQSRMQQLLRDAEAMVRALNKRQAHQILDSDSELERLIYSSERLKLSYEGALIEDSLDRLRGYLMNIAELTIDYLFKRAET